VENQHGILLEPPDEVPGLRERIDQRFHRCTTR
jgi:hypothetical protein